MSLSRIFYGSLPKINFKVIQEKALRRENAKLKKGNEALKQKITELKKTVAEEKVKNTELTEQLEIERGNTFTKKKAEFASRHI